MTAAYAPPAEVEELREVVTAFTAREVAPLVAAAERDEAFPRELFDRWAKAGLLGLRVPEEYGGSDAGLQAEVMLVEETAKVCAGFATSLIVQLTVVPGIIRAFGTEVQKAALLPGLGSAEMVGSLAVTEPDTGSDVRAIKARAERTPDGYRISGSKVFITNGTLADFYIVAAVVDPDAGHRGIGLFVVRRDAPGLITVEKMRKTSVRSSDTAILAFDGCAVDESDLLGGDLNGFAKLMSTFDGERVVHAARALGLARACFDAANDYASQRQQFGSPIRSFQAVAFKLADMVVGIDAATLLVYRAAALADAGLPFHRAASVAKLFTTETARAVATEAMQVHGSYGLTADFPIGRYVADAQLETIGTGTSEIQRLIISRELEAEHERRPR
ncbi:acyl-CoA dehydrogenase [Actinomadura sp. KC345]|uniref:acyl-CoA dehydrogenase family protein n=1 Tax=Actinomadura sp. KC345 TaxID=2530371 RepID=UPI00104EF164|nr:acyl-CoA dehydrogenase family protein [Actinomadura sp. KC345]TDC58552.1 acyl-CoA dehydrogenase [Actinomadura sp. KC345]